tara:strand:+ start:279 stop:464 length:186 start_codon:yes stop_codon:yes gene_type:complete
MMNKNERLHAQFDGIGVRPLCDNGSDRVVGQNQFRKLMLENKDDLCKRCIKHLEKIDEKNG